MYQTRHSQKPFIFKSEILDKKGFLKIDELVSHVPSLYENIDYN